MKNEVSNIGIVDPAYQISFFVVPVGHQQRSVRSTLRWNFLRTDKVHEESESVEITKNGGWRERNSGNVKKWKSEMMED